MKQITTMSRLVNELEKLFRALNADFFEGKLDTPVITVSPSSRSYAHYTPWDAWQTKEDGRREINIASGTLNRPLEEIVASLMHEMCHMWNDVVIMVQDTSNGSNYHNKQFAITAEGHGLRCSRSDKYGWSRTVAGDELIEWLLNHDEFREVEMCRTSPEFTATGYGTHAASGTAPKATATKAKSSTRRYICPCCKTTIRATKTVNIICGDCLVKMVEG